jgi:hypothetical protein
MSTTEEEQSLEPPCMDVSEPSAEEAGETVGSASR